MIDWVRPTPRRVTLALGFSAIPVPPLPIETKQVPAGTRTDPPPAGINCIDRILYCYRVVRGAITFCAKVFDANGLLKFVVSIPGYCAAPTLKEWQIISSTDSERVARGCRPNPDIPICKNGQ